MTYFSNISSAIIAVFSGSSVAMHALMLKYGYAAVFVLMSLESASLPIPSDVLLPLAGYYIAYVFGKDIVYKHLELFHLKKSTLMSFDRWFERNGRFAVFVSRLLPVVRGPISFTAGFAMMDAREFFLFSMLGAVIWDTALVMFGYYAVALGAGVLIITVAGTAALVIYYIYRRGFASKQKNVRRK